MQYLTRFYVGLQDKDNRLEHNADELAYITSGYFDNFTMIKAQGFYNYNDGTMCNETSYIIEVFHDEPLEHFEYINEVKRILNQECVLAYTQNVQAYCV